MILFGAPVIRRYDLLWRLLKSVERSELKPDRVVVVDNGCKIDEHPWRSMATDIVHPGKNIGCSGAWNTLLDHVASSDDIVIVSNDDITLSPDSLSMIVDGFQQSDFVAGHGFSLFAMRRRLVDQIGFFDEHFFPAYFEDNDYTWRMKLAGFKHHVVDGKADHVGSASLHCLPDEEQREFGRVFDKLRLYYFQKWGGRPGEERYKRPFNGNPPKGWKLRSITT